MSNPFTITRRTFLTGLSAGVAVKVLGCGSRPETNPGPDAGTTPDFRIERRFPLPSYLTADLISYKNQIISLQTESAWDRGNRLFLNPDDPVNVIQIDFPDDQRLNQFVPLSLDQVVVTAHSPLLTHSGFWVFNVNSPQDLPPPIPLPSGYNIVGGAVATSDKLWIAASSATLENGWLRFNSGGIFLYDLDANGNVRDASAPRFIATSGANPTGLVLRRDSSEVFVLNSGGFIDRREPSIDIINTLQERIVKPPIFLSEGVTAQVSPRLALSPDEKVAIVGTADGTGRIFFIDLENDRLLLESELSGTEFHTSILADEDFVYVGDFYSEQLPVLDWGGNLLTDDDLEQGFSQAGPSMLLGGELFQSLPNEVVVISRGV